MRLLLLFIIGLTFGFGGGFLVAGGMGESSHDHAGHGDTHHGMSTLAVWEGPAPDLSVEILPDMGNAANLHITADGFTFTPETVNTDPTQGTGHAHIYIDGVKLARAYSNWFHIDHVETGQVIRVTLNADNHAEWGKDNRPLAVEITVP
jgi:hypothetical protein